MDPCARCKLKMMVNVTWYKKKNSKKTDFFFVLCLVVINENSIFMLFLIFSVSEGGWGCCAGSSCEVLPDSNGDVGTKTGRTHRLSVSLQEITLTPAFPSGMQIQYSLLCSLYWKHSKLAGCFHIWLCSTISLSLFCFSLSLSLSSPTHTHPSVFSEPFIRCINYAPFASIPPFLSLFR